MAQNEGSIAGKQVNVFVIVDVLDPAAMSSVEEDGEGIMCIDSHIGGGSAGQESFRFIVHLVRTRKLSQNRMRENGDPSFSLGAGEVDRGFGFYLCEQPSYQPLD